MLIIRLATAIDLDKVYELETLCFKDPYPKQLFYMLLSLYPELFFVAEDNGEIVGYVVGVVRTDGYGHVVSICVHPEYRKRGIGSALINSVENAMNALFNVCRYRLEVRVSNDSAIKFYKKHRYVIVSRIPHYYSDGEDAYLMIKDLCNSTR